MMQEDEIMNDELTRARSIRDDLRPIDVSDHIKQKANEIYNRLQCTTKRGKRRKLLIFYCLLNAHAECHIPVDPKNLSAKVGIKPGDITRSLSMFSEAQTGYKPQITKVTPLEIIPEYCKVFNFDDDSIDQVMELAQEILDKNPGFMEKKPQNVAVGIIVYFSTINGITFCKKDLSKILNLSEVTINSIYKEVSSVHNN
jgi:transcription initiation factor TFIIIB Brf1 subunit/transcription initiation factor TFIIB